LLQIGGRRLSHARLRRLPQPGLGAAQQGQTKETAHGVIFTEYSLPFSGSRIRPPPQTLPCGLSPQAMVMPRIGWLWRAPLQSSQSGFGPSLVSMSWTILADSVPLAA
jgi:hypothetical protein